MKNNKAMVIVLTVVAIMLVAFAPTLNVSIGFGLLFLICPIMMLAMMSMMGHGKDKHH